MLATEGSKMSALIHFRPTLDTLRAKYDTFTTWSREQIALSIQSTICGIHESKSPAVTQDWHAVTCTDCPRIMTNMDAVVARGWAGKAVRVDIATELAALVAKDGAL